jgi:hypothetical protein
MSKFSTHAKSGFNRNNQQKGSHNGGSKRFGSNNGSHTGSQQNGSMFGNHRRNAKPNFKVVNKADALTGFKGEGLYASKFVPANSGGLMAANRVDGRIVFPERNGLQPKNDGKSWQFQIVGENPKQTVYFARIIDPNASTAIKIFVDKNGKMVCTGRGLLVTRFKSKKASPVRFAEYRSATPNMGFEPRYDDRFYADDGYDYMGGCGCDHDCDCEDEDRTDFDNEVASIWDSLPTKPVNCHACGFEDCRCDGTASDWVPARTTLNVLG